MRISPNILMTVLLACAATVAWQRASLADVVVVRESAPQAVIVVPEQASSEEALSAERFQHYVKQITAGEATLEIVSELKLAERSDVAGKIHIGRTQAASNVLTDLKQRKAPAEASLVVSEGDTVFVTGIDPIGTLHATYFLLEDFGCRWYMPAEWGIVVPRKTELVIPTQETYRAPSFALRSGMTHATTEIDEDASWASFEWGRGNHLGGWRWWGAGHSYRFLIPKENFEAHPEWFALVDGKRIPDQVCVTHPEGRAFALEEVRKALAGYGDNPPELICISPDDTIATKFCQCEGCQQYVPDLPDGSGKDFSEGHDRIIAYANFFADALRDEYPNTRVTYMVDYHSQGFPSIVKPASNSSFWVIHWTGDQFHGQDDSTEMGQAINAWSQFGMPMIAYTYWGSHTNWSFWPVVHTIEKELRYYHAKGLVGVCSETHESWGAQHLNFIVYPRLMWDVDTDVDAWINEFCEKFYGPAAAPMRKYYALLEQAAQQGPPQHRYRQTLIATFTPKVLAGLRKQIQLAEEAIRAQDDKVYQQRMDFVRAGFDVGDLYFSSEHLMREYPKSKDPTIRPRMVANMKRVIELCEDPCFKAGLVSHDAVVLLDDIKKLYEQYRQGTTFAGDFKYFEDYYIGGRTFIDVDSRSGFVDDLYGLSLDAHSSGTLVYRFDAAQPGQFATVTGSLVLTNPTSAVPLKLEVRSRPDQPWAPVSVSGSGVNVDFDLTSVASGESSIWLKIQLTNPTAAGMHVLHQLHLSGKIGGNSE